MENNQELVEKKVDKSANLENTLVNPNPAITSDQLKQSKRNHLIIEIVLGIVAILAIVALIIVILFVK
ncbi:MAG: hypothetical protein HUJ52_00170 [Malacoplasma sp.]|nr:hypothetical protein [Malacoplasma sp.]